jgi:hypothetical protein
MASDDYYAPESKEQLLKFAARGVLPGDPELHKAYRVRSQEDFGVTPWQDRNVFQRLFDNLASAVGLQDPRDVKAAKAQDELKAIYAPIFAQVQKDPSLKTVLTGLGMIEPAQGIKQPAGLVAGAPATEQPVAPVMSTSPPGLPPAALPAPLAGVGAPLPVPGPGTVMDQQAALFNNFLENSTGQPGEYDAYKANVALPPEPSTMPTGPMVGALPPLRAGMPQPTQPVWVNGTPPPPGMLDAADLIHAPVHELTNLVGQMPVNLLDANKRRTYPPHMAQAIQTKEMEIAATAEEKAKDRSAALLAAHSDLGKLMSDRDKLNPSSADYATYQKAIELKSAEHEPRNVDTENRVAMSMFGVPFLKLTDAVVNGPAIKQLASKGYAVQPGLTQRQAVDQVIFHRQKELVEYKGLTVPMAVPLAAEKRTDLYDRTAFEKKGVLLPAPAGITTGQAATGNYVSISDKQREQLAHVEKSGTNVQMIFDMADKLLTAAGPLQAGKQWLELQAGALTKSNPDAALFVSTREALANSLSKAFGEERGVLTNRDVDRWVRALPTFGDTLTIKNQKKAIFLQIYKEAVAAQRRSIAGDNIEQSQMKIRGLIDRAEKLTVEDLVNQSKP